MEENLNEALAKAAISVARRDRRKINRVARRCIKQMTSFPFSSLPVELREQHRRAVGHMMLTAPVEVLQQALAMVQGSLGKAAV